jgi:hypothetical protein
MLDLFLATSIAFGSESVNAIGLRSKSSCSGGVCSSSASAPVVVDAKNKPETKVVAAQQKQSRFKGVLRGKKCR